MSGGDLIVARRYAKALYEASEAANKVDQVRQELSNWVALLENQEDLSRFIHHPNLEPAAKVELVQSLFGTALSDLTFNTIRLIMDRDRESMFPALLHAYEKYADEAQGKASAIVYSARSLDEQELQQVKERFSALTGKTIEVQNKIDSTLLGGLRVRIGDLLYDGSITAKLNRMEKNLINDQAM